MTELKQNDRLLRTATERLASEIRAARATMGATLLLLVVGIAPLLLERKDPHDEIDS